jgi:hypothetical protein
MHMLVQEGQVFVTEAGLFKAVVTEAARQYKFKSFSFSSSKRGPGDEKDDGSGKRQKTGANTNAGDGEFILESVVRHVLK